MMIRHIAYITGLLLMALCSCSDEILLPDTTSGAEVPDGTPIEIEASAQLPEMSSGPATRALTDNVEKKDLETRLKVNILMFDAAGIMIQYIPPTDITIGDIDVNTQTVHFKVSNILSSSQPRRLHFVITEQDLTAIEGGELVTSMANESTVMPALMTSGDNDAYWGMKEVKKVTANMQLEICAIRNFVKLTVKAGEGVPADFIQGYAVVNRPTIGTVAPYIYKDNKFATFLDPNTETNPDSKYKPRSYENITNTQGYLGVNPAGQEKSMACTTEAKVKEALATSQNNPTAPTYFYERSQSGIETVGSDAKATYLIIKGRYDNPDDNTDEPKDYYYKVDLGHTDAGKFKFYDLLRNFHYNVIINSVAGPGADTPGQAMAGAAYNNISASVVVQDLFSISYTGEQITVSDTEVIFTEKTEDFQLRFRYYLPQNPNEANSANVMNPANLKVYDLGVNDESNDFSVTTTSIELSGDVIDKAWITKEASDEWYVLHIKTKDVPTDQRRLEQNLRIYYSGMEAWTANLGRTITLMLRQPWDLSNVSAGAPTDALNSEFTVNFTLPPGLSNSQFPLTLTFESDKQNIYAKQGTELQVAVGKSGFKGATTDNVILYEYVIPRSMYDAETGSHFTATFLTNTELSDDEKYSTAGIDAATNANGNRTTNNGKSTFCIRIANKPNVNSHGQADPICINPYYVNITRQTPTNP